MSKEWPAPMTAVRAARALLQSATGVVAVACHSDVDGLSAAAIVRRTLAARGLGTRAIVSRRGDHVHTPQMRERIRASGANTLVVVDMGSRPAAIAAGVPTLVLDHHDGSRGLPEDAIVVNGYDRPPVATSSVLAYHVCAPLADLSSICWLAALGAVGDLGAATAFEELLGCAARGKRWSEAVALLNAARRASADDGETALAVLEHAASVDDVLSDDTPGVRTLRAYRSEVSAELARCSRVPPRRVGDAMLIRFSSPAQVHPVVATKWTRRLAPAIVIAANDGFIAGRVNFAVRCARDIDLLEWMRTRDFTPDAPGEFANGHPRATGGSLSPADFERFLAAVGAEATGERTV